MEIVFEGVAFGCLEDCFKIDGIVWKSGNVVIVIAVENCFKIDGIVWKYVEDIHEMIRDGVLL